MFGVESATGEEELTAALADGSWTELVQPMDCGLMALPAITLHIEDEKDLRHGQAVDVDDTPGEADGQEARGYGEDGSLVGIMRWDAELRMWRPRKIFPPGS
jgi:tRNA U55 pseudouridine synthase TruB